MKRLRDFSALFMAIVGFLLAGASAKADDLTVALAEPYQIGPETVFVFDGTLTNNTGGTLYLNGSDDFVDEGLTLDPTPFNEDAPETLGAGDSWTGELFTVTAPSYDAEDTNLYAGVFTVEGGDDMNSDDILGTADFGIQVTTPEPSSLMLFATGLLALGFQVRRKLFART